MKKKLIAVDLDDVLSSQVERLIDFISEEFSVHITQENFKEPGEYWTYFEELPGFHPEESGKMFKKFLDTEQPYAQTVLPDAVDTIDTLKAKGYDFVIITSRGLEWQKGTEEWLERHVPRLFSDMHFVELWNTGSKKATKAMICNEIGASYLIDDNVEHCNLADEAGVNALLFGEWGWNMFHDVRPGVHRVADWLAVQEYFSEQG